MTSSHQDVPPCQWFARLGPFLDRRSAARLAWLFLGAVLAPRAEDCHKLDPHRWPEHPISTLLHDGRGRRQEGQGHLRPPGLRVSQALRQAGEEAVRDVRGNMATSGRSYPCRAGGRAGWVAFCTDLNATIEQQNRTAG
jgi:hypothetical protein